MAKASQRLLHHVPFSTEPATMFRRMPGRKTWANSQRTHLADDTRKAITTVAVKRPDAPPRPTTLPLDCRQQRQHFQERFLIPDVRRCREHQQRHAATVYDQMAFTAVFRAIYGVRSRVEPPKTARTDAESTAASDRSTASYLANRFRSWWCSFFQTPASVQSRKRLQHVDPLTPKASCGNICHGMPLRRTNKMPRRQSRSDPNGRPPLCCGPCRGNNGSTSRHSASGKSSFDTFAPLTIRSIHKPYRHKRGL